MATTTGTFVFYNSLRFYNVSGIIDLNTDTFLIGLSTSTYVPDDSNHDFLADITNEVVGNGYARQTIAGVTLTPSATPFGATITFDFTDPVFTATGGSIVARHWWVFDDTTTAPVDALVAHGLLDNTPADVTVTDGNTLTVQINASGFYTIT